MQKKVTHLFIMIVVLLVPLLAPHQAHACSCDIPPLTKGWEDSESIFLGTVREIQYLTLSGVYSSTEPVTYTFQVHHAWKGSNRPQLQVQSAREIASCGAWFELGKAYIVYAYRQGEILRSGLCNNHPANSIAPYRWKIFNTVERIRESFGLPRRNFWENGT